MNHSILKTFRHSMMFLLLTGVGSPVFAASPSRGVSYSPDHWPNRWTSAIRQQQNGNYPTRQDKQTPPPDLPPALPGQGNEVSEQDLFYSPSAQQAYGQPRGQRGRRVAYANKIPHFARFRDHRGGMQQGSRNPAFAYYGMPALQYGGNMNSYASFPYGTAPIGIDPVLGHPGMGIPIMPGTPYGYPFVAYPGTGFPGAGSMWNPPFGTW